MSSILILSIISIYFGALIFISYFTSKNADTQAFFTGNRSSKWYLVAFGMIGTSISGVTFISVPGEVGTNGFAYFQIVLGYLVGYAFIGLVLLPLYYKLNLVSIYTYLEQRFGNSTYKTGSFFFLLSRTIGASFRLFLAADVLQLMIFDQMGIPFELTVFITIALIWVYTFKGGIKTIVWTDSFQTLFLIGSLILCVLTIKNELGWSMGDLVTNISESKYSQIFFWDLNDNKYFFKQFISGAFIAIVMTGLDQDLMQKNLTCKNIAEGQKNMFTFTIIMLIVNFLFLTLGALLYTFAAQKGFAIPAKTDQLFPYLALNFFGTPAAILFLLGIIASTYASADSALASLTTAFCIDFLGFEKRTDENERNRLKLYVHLGFSFLLLFVIIIFRYANNQAVVSSVFKAAGYTYGPLLGLFFFGLFTKMQVKDRFIPVVCFASPIICFILNQNSQQWLGGYKIGFEILLINGFLTFMGMWVLRKPENQLARS
ncbi:MAG: sodium:solute symporter [Cytophagales bacterium]